MIKRPRYPLTFYRLFGKICIKFGANVASKFQRLILIRTNLVSTKAQYLSLISTFSI